MAKGASELGKQDLTRILRQTRVSCTARGAALLELLAATGVQAVETVALTVGAVTPRERSGMAIANVVDRCGGSPTASSVVDSSRGG